VDTVRIAKGARPPKWLRSGSVLWAGAFLCLVVVGVTCAFLLHEARAREASEVQSAELYARVLQDHTERTFNTIDIAMAALVDTVEADLRGRDAARLDPDLASALSGLPFIRSLSLMTPEGRVFASSSRSNIGVLVRPGLLKLPARDATNELGTSIAGRDLSDVAASEGAPHGSAVRTFIPLVRALGSGTQEQVYLVAVLNPEFFANEHELALADPTRAAGVFSFDATMLAGTGNLKMSPGASAAAHVFFKDFLPARESGSQVGPGIDGAKVVGAFRVLRQRPVVIIVERDYARVRAAFQQTLVLALGGAGGAIGVVLTMTLMAWRSLKGHEAVSAALDASQVDIAASERNLRLLVESVHELIFRADADGRILFINGRWQELSGRPAEHALGRRFADLCREDERPVCEALFREAPAGEETVQIHVGAADGRVLTLDLSVARVPGPRGGVTGFAGFAVDVSAREAAKQALESQLTFTAQLLELSPTPIFVKDEAGRFVTVNRAWLDLMNLALPDVLGRDSSELFGHDTGLHVRHDARLARSGERISYENELRIPGRTPRDTVVTKVRFTGAHGAAAGTVGSIVDVTEFREAERSVRKARDAAQRASEAKSEFIANISHELRTPLQGIIGFSELGRDLSEALPDVQDMFTDIHAGGQRMLGVVNALLDVSQMDSEPGSIPLVRTDIAQLVRDTLDPLGPALAARALRIDVHGMDEPVEADVDDVRFQQAVRHVVSNAIRYSPEGGVIHVSLHDAGAAGVRLVVRDHGPGIPPEELELVFEAFVQSSRTRDGSGGTGLGLTIARKIMGAHAGRITAANAPEGGAVLTLCLPAARPDADASLRGDQPVSESEVM
jgi:PAS domain S-box-containing protein